MDATAATRVAAPLPPATGGTYARRRALPRLRRRRSPGDEASGRGCSALGAVDRARRRRLVPLRQRPGSDRREQAARRPAVHGHPRGARRRPDHRATGSSRTCAGCRTATSPPGSSSTSRPVEGTGLARGGIVTILVSTGQEERDGARRRRLAGRRTPWRRSRGPASSQRASASPPTSRPAPSPRRIPPPGTSLVEGATVRINYSTGPKQVAVPAGRRPRLLGRAAAAPGRRLRGRAHGRRERPAGRRRREPGSDRIVDGDEGLDGDAVRLERPPDDAGAGRHGPDDRRCEDDADGRRASRSR